MTEYKENASINANELDFKDACIKLIEADIESIEKCLDERMGIYSRLFCWVVDVGVKQTRLLR